MFLTSLFKGMTARQAETPPSKVLDLGCGSGLWVLEAAKCWPVRMRNSGYYLDILTDYPIIRPEIYLCRSGLPAHSA